MSRRIRKIAWGLLVVLSLVILAVAVTSSSWFHRALERRAIAQMEAMTGARVEIREFRFTPLIFQMTLHGLVLHGTESLAEPPLFKARAFVIRLSPFAYLRRRILVRSLAWDDAEIHLRTDSEGKLNLPPLPSAASRGTPLSELINLSVGQVSISHTTLYWNDRQIPLEIAARDLTLQLRLQKNHNYSGALAASIVKFGDLKWDLPPATLAANFDFSSSNFDVTSLRWRSTELAAETSFHLIRVPETRVKMTYGATGSLDRVAQAIGLKNIAGGNATVEGKAVYEQGAWSTSGKVFGREVRARISPLKLETSEASADYSADRNHIELRNLKLSTLGGEIRGRSEVRLDESPPRFQLEAKLRGVSLARALRVLPNSNAISPYFRPDSEVQGTLNASWKGAFAQFSCPFDVQFVAPRSTSPGRTPMSGSAKGALTLERGLAFSFEDALFETPHSSLSLKGSLRTTNTDLAVRFTSSDFEEWRAAAEYFADATQPIALTLESPASFTGTIAGSYAHPQISGHLQAGSFIYRDAKWDELEADVSATPDNAKITSAHLARGSSVLKAEASGSLNHWQFDRSGPVHVMVRARRTPIEGLEAAFGLNYPISGLASGAVNLDGEISDLTGTGSLLLERGNLFGQLLDSLRFSLKVAGTNWNFSQIEARKGNAHVAGFASFDPARRSFSVQLSGEGISPQAIDWWRSQSGVVTSRARLQGLAAFKLDAHGVPGNTALSSTWSVRNLALEGSTIGDFDGRIDWQGQKITAQVNGHGQGGSVHLSGEATSGGDWPFSLSGPYTDLRADPWIRLLAHGNFDAQSVASGIVDVTGSLRHLASIKAQSQIQKLKLNFGDLEWTNPRPIEVSYSGQKLVAPQFQMLGPSTNMVVDGSIYFGNPVELSATAHGAADAKLLNIIDPALAAVGRFAIDLRVNGNLQRPSVNGTVNVDNLTLSYPGLPLRMAGLQGQITLQGDRLEITSLRQISGQNSIAITGSATLSRTPRYDLRAQIQNARVEFPVQFTSMLSGVIHLTGTAQNGLMTGDLAVSQTTVPQNFTPLGWVAEMARQAEVPTPAPTSGPGSKIRLDMQITSEPEVRIDSPNLRLVATIATTLRGTLASPVVFGSVHLESGLGTARGDQYKLNRGEITMSNPFRTQPVLDLEAQIRIENYELTLTITGPIENPRIAYRSDPPLPTGDILSLLALGYTRQQEEMQAAGSQRSSTIGTSAFLSQALSSELTGRFQRLFGVSRVRVNPNVTGPGSATGTRITVEQQLTHDITVTYVTNTAYSQERVIQFDWAVSDTVSLVGIRDQNGVYGMEIRFRHRFK